MSNTNNTDIIILSLVKDEKSFQVTKACVDSYLATADELINKIYVVETNPLYVTTFDSDKVEVLKPNEEFNYNRFYNIALERCTSEFVMGPNNDVVLQPGCLQRIVKEFNENPNIHSISPVYRNWHRHTHMYLPKEDKLYYGYEVALHMYGCAFCCRRSVFEKIGYLDETFYFFYQDNDYAMCLERNGLWHGVHTGAHIVHAERYTNVIADKKFQYLPENMEAQGQLLAKKWHRTEPFASGGFAKFKEYPHGTLLQ